MPNQQILYFFFFNMQTLIEKKKNTTIIFTLTIVVLNILCSRWKQALKRTIFLNLNIFFLNIFTSAEASGGCDTLVSVSIPGCIWKVEKCI